MARGRDLPLVRLPFRSRPLRRREQVGLVPGVKLDRVAVALDRDHAPHPKLRALPEPARQRSREIDGKVVRQVLPTGNDPDPAAHVVLADFMACLR